MTDHLTKVPCPNCGSGEFRLVYPAAESNMLACRSCDLVFFNPLPSVDYLAEYYSSQSGYLTSIEENYRDFQADPARWESSADPILEKLQQHGMPAGGSILDVGCAWGFFLQIAQRRGFDVHGLELSSHTSEWARGQGIDVRTGHLGGHDYTEESFDAVTINNVLEHSIHPVEDLKSARMLIKPGGLLYVAVPNQRSTVANVDNYYWKMKSWPNHLFYFDRDTLSRSLQLAEYEILDVFSQVGEADPADDFRVLRERLHISDDAHIERVRDLLDELGYSQELVIVARR